MTKEDTMTEESALATSTGWANIEGIIGYLGFRAANFLVGTGRYCWHKKSFWGYLVKHIGAFNNEGLPLHRQNR